MFNAVPQTVHRSIQYIWWSEALHGAIAPFQHHGAKPATCWPEPIGVGSAFNTTLFRALGELTSTEGRVRQCICLVCSTAFVAKTVPLPCVFHCLRG